MPEPQAAEIPTYAMLDVWCALGGDPVAFDRMLGEPHRTPVDTWAQLLAAITGRVHVLLADTNPPIGPEFQKLLFGEAPTPSDEVPWKTVAKNLSKELTMERNWRMRLQEELWALDPSKDPRRDGHGPEDYPHEHVYRCQDCGEIGRGPEPTEMLVFDGPLSEAQAGVIRSIYTLLKERIERAEAANHRRWHGSGGGEAALPSQYDGQDSASPGDAANPRPEPPSTLQRYDGGVS